MDTASFANGDGCRAAAVPPCAACRDAACPEMTLWDGQGEPGPNQTAPSEYSGYSAGLLVAALGVGATTSTIPTEPL
jgi:hypothetical protein